MYRIKYPIRFAHSTLTDRAQICTFFSSSDQPRKVAFVKAGLESVEKALSTIAPRTVVLLAMFLVCFASRILALDPNKRISQYQHRSWRVEDGTLPNIPNWIAQATDGYLMVGVLPMGALQFDGVR